MKRTLPTAGARAALSQCRAGLDRPVPNDSLVFYRVAFGLILAWQVYRLIAGGALTPLFVAPEMFFTYYGFG